MARYDAAPLNLAVVGLTPTQTNDAITAARGSRGFMPPLEGNTYSDIRGGTTSVTIYGDCDLIAVNTVRAGTCIIENRRAIDFLTSARRMMERPQLTENFRRTVRQTVLPGSGDLHLWRLGTGTP